MGFRSGLHKTESDMQKDGAMTIELSDILLKRYGLMRNERGEHVPRVEHAPWSPPPLTEQQQKERDEYVKKWNLPF